MKIIKDNKIFYKCFTCKKIKKKEFFYKYKNSRCKECCKILYKENKAKNETYYIKNKEKIKKYYEDNKVNFREYYIKNIDKYKLRAKEWKERNPDKVRSQKRKERLKSFEYKPKKELW